MDIMDIEFEEFKEIIAEPTPPEPEKKAEVDAFLFLCFMQIFRSDPPNGADVIFAVLAATSFSKSNFVEGNRIANKGIAIRHPRMSLKAKPSMARGLKM